MSILVEAIEPLSQVARYFSRYDEDVIDRINHKYSTFMFVILAFVVTANSYVGELIKCWAPAQFPEFWVEYTNSVCWISNTYYVPITEYNILEADRKEIVYYQWVPLVLLLQAFLFYLPSIHWYVLNNSTGIEMKRIVQTFRQVEHINPEIRDKTTKTLIKHVDRTLMAAKEIRTGGCAEFKHKMAECGCFCGKRHGNFLITVYLLTKLLYIGNVILQLYMMNIFLGTDYMFYGLEVLQDLGSTGEYRESRRFPRVTLCDFEVRAVGRNHPYTVQCTLPVNLFNEKLFIFIWFWLVFLGIINILGLFSWLWVLFATNRHSYVKKYLKVWDVYDKENDRVKLRHFCNTYLRQDGHFILRMLAKNTNEVVVGEFVKGLWEYYERNHCNKKHRKPVHV